jgi:hypothetical protein
METNKDYETKWAVGEYPQELSLAILHPSDGGRVFLRNVMSIYQTIRYHSPENYKTIFTAGRTSNVKLPLISYIQKYPAAKSVR